MTLRTLTHAELQISPLNVRQTSKPIDALAENIAAEGMLFPLIVHRMELSAHLFPDWGDRGGNAAAEWGAYAGGRRWRAIGKLIAEGRLPADHPIECIVREFDPARMTDVSLAENLIRHDLDAWEVHAAIARSVDQGHTPAQIAATLGQDEKWVRQQLRLGTLIPEIFRAYVDKTIAVEEAMAYAATEDLELQALAWRHFHRKQAYDRRASHIRAFLKIGDRELDQLLRFVGDAAYRGAGGRFELDLFADGAPEDAWARGRVVDETLLRQLAEGKLEETRAQIRTRTGRKDLRFAKAPPDNAGTTDFALKIEPEYRGKKVIALPAGDVVATLAIIADGEVEVSYWWTSRKAKSAASREATEAKLKGEIDKVPGESPTAMVARVSQSGALVGDGDAFLTIDNYAKAQAARASVKEAHGLTGGGLHVVRSLRRALLRAVLVADAHWGAPKHESGNLGRDYVIWSALRQELGGKRSIETGARGLGGLNFGSEDAEPRDVLRDFLAEEPAHHTWERAVALVAGQPFMSADDPAESLARYVALGEEMKNLAAAVLAGHALLRSANVQGWRVAAHDKLAEIAGADDASLRTGWKPTSRFVALFPPLKRLELAQPFVDAEAFRTWHKRDDKTITGACAGALEQQSGWVHPLLSFNCAQVGEAGSAEGNAAPGPDDDVDPNVNDTAAADRADSQVRREIQARMPVPVQ